MPVRSAFPTLIYDSALGLPRKLMLDLLWECRRLQKVDEEGLAWSKDNYATGGYTSYGSLDALNRTSSTFDLLKQRIDRHAKIYAKTLDADLAKFKLEMVSLWVNVLPPKGYHSLHLHPLSTISGTVYLQTPANSGGIKFEDPRMTCFMGSIPRRQTKPVSERFLRINPKPGKIVMFESWLRHEVEQNRGQGNRISVSFNYHWT